MHDQPVTTGTADSSQKHLEVITCMTDQPQQVLLILVSQTFRGYHMHDQPVTAGTADSSQPNIYRVSHA